MGAAIRLACLATAAVLVAAGGLPSRAHGESRGLHLHVSPDPAAPGATVTVEVTCENAVERVEAALTGGRSVRRKLDPPVARFELRLEVPEKNEGETINVHVEALTTGDKTYRATAVLRIVVEPPPPETS
jgi:hypothetical protein